MLAKPNRGVVSKGSCASVISGSIYGKENLKFKIFDSFNNPQALEICYQEIKIYLSLEFLQGKVIPKFYGFFNLYGFLILALEDCGIPVPETEYPSLKMKIEKALQAIKIAGVEHHDLECRNGIYPNILVKNKKIRIIDFHISEFNESYGLHVRKKRLVTRRTFKDKKKETL